MRYQGGKERIAKHIVAHLPDVSDGVYFEPMVGGLSVGSRVKCRHAIFADACEPLITLYRAWSDGWRPPDTVGEADYAHFKATQDPQDPMTAFVGFGCSWGAKWFGGYARSGDQRSINFAARTTRSLDRKFKRLRELANTFEFRVLDALADPWPASDLVYCDPPYKGTQAYEAVAAFDHYLFWRSVMREARTRPIYVSECVAPTWVRLEWQTEKRGTLDTYNKKRRIERLFSVDLTDL